MKRAGLYAMELGTDATSDETLSGLNKLFSFEDVLQFNRICAEEEVPVAHFVIFGGPEETADTVQKAAAADVFETALEIGYEGFGNIACTDAAKEGISAFLEKRKPDFK